MKLYSVYDVVMHEFVTPFAAKNDEDAKRSFGACFSEGNPNPFFREHKNDFEMYFVGEFNEQTGEFFEDDQENCKWLVCRGSDF